MAVLLLPVVSFQHPPKAGWPSHPALSFWLNVLAIVKVDVIINQSSGFIKGFGHVLVDALCFEDVRGYLSSAFAYSAGESSVVDYYLVSAPEEIYGVDYSDKIYETDEFISIMREENKRSLNYGSICFEVERENKLSILPKDFVTIYGKVSDSSKLRVVSMSDSILCGSIPM